MITKSQIKLIQSLKNTRERSREGLFVVEGVKMVEELLLSGFTVKHLFATSDWEFPKGYIKPVTSEAHSLFPEQIEDWELARISSLTTPNKVLAVASIPQQPEISDLSHELVLLLDRISDPGNMGTIIRTAEWFGIDRVMASDDSTDFWNPKVVQASMGSLFRMKLNSVNIQDFLMNFTNMPIYGTRLEGEDISRINLTPSGIIIIGNESHGISHNILNFITHKITIPAAQTSGSESLNASIAAAITCYEFRRQFPR